MKTFCILVFLVGVSISNALPTDKKSNYGVDRELDDLERLLRERILDHNIEDKDGFLLEEVKEEKEKNRRLEQKKTAGEDEREEKDGFEDEEKKKLTENETPSSFHGGLFSPELLGHQKQQRQTSSEEEEETNIDDPETIDPDDPLENLLEGMIVEDNGKQHKVQGLHPEKSSKTYGDSHDIHKQIPEQQNQSNTDGSKRNFDTRLYRLWHKAVVPYVIDSSLSTSTSAIIQAAVKDFSDFTCVQWVPQSQAGLYGLNHNNYVRFINGNGCWSYVGNVADLITNSNNIQEISIQDPGCDSKATVIHEMLHAMGGNHEQSRTDRDNYVEILYDNLVNGQNNNNFDKENTDDFNPYDAESVLQYSLYSFSVNGQRTMKFKDQRLEFLADSAEGLEFYDIQDVTDTYRCAAGCNNPPSCQNGGFVNFQCVCVCPDGLTGATCTDTVSNSATCGGVVNIGQGEVKYIQSPNYGTSNYPTNLECTWLIKGTTNNLVRATVEYMDIAAGAACYHWLEYRYNLLGQKGPKRCGTHRNSGDEFWDSTTDELSNAMMIKFNSKLFSNQPAKTGFRIKLENIGSGCVSNPCLYGTCTSPEGTSSYTCTCDAGVSGQNCDTIGATATIECTFEYGEKCFLDNDKTDQFDWDLSSEGTKSNNTGPSRAYQEYQYVYIETSSPRVTNDKAVLVNNVMTLQRSDKCLTFYYHMYGSSVGTLNVYTEGTGVTKSQVFSQSGNKGNVWIKGQLDIPAMDNLKIYFEGIRGTGPFGDIALDDIVLTPGTCANPITTGTSTTTPLTTTTSPTTTTTSPTTTTTSPTTTTTSPTTTTTSPTTTTTSPTTTTTSPTTTTTSPTTTTTSPTTTTTSPTTTTTSPTTTTTTSPTTTTTIGSTTFVQTCTFEQGTSCFLRDSTNDDFDWTIKSGDTSSSGTGPSGAFEGTMYTYIEVSSPVTNGADATLVSSASLPGPDYCLVFAYHMLGSSSMGDLVISTGVQSPDTDWLRIPGNQGNQWQEEAVDFTGGQNLKLFITANKGSTWRGDIAIDNLRLYADVCNKVVGACFGNPCQNGGSCTVDMTNAVGYTCTCLTGFAGQDCQLIDASKETDLFCGFENNENCVFEDDSGGDFVWSRIMGGTPSSGTGPSQAYEGTYYKYMEASSPRVNGERAILSTESRQLASLTQYCLKFHYHMMGTPGSLTISVGERYGQNSTIWTMSGNQGDQWKEQQVQIDSSYNDPEIFIIAERGTSWKGDIALDSIYLRKETCPPLSPCDSTPCSNLGTCIDTSATTFSCVCPSGWTGSTCDTFVPLNEFKCDFENGETCIFTDSTADDFNWSRKSGSTPSANTGPTSAYTGNYYLYTEVSLPVKSRQKAMLTSENTQLKASSYCLSMAYHRKGYLGPLTVRAGERGSSVMKQEWIKTGSQGSSWQLISINIPYYSDPVIEIEGQKATSFRGDMAIDDIVLKEGSCIVIAG